MVLRVVVPIRPYRVRVGCGVMFSALGVMASCDEPGDGAAPDSAMMGTDGTDSDDGETSSPAEIPSDAESTGDSGPMGTVEGGGNFIVSRTWKGAVYLVADPATTYTPDNFESRAPGAPLCVSGSVAPSPTYGGFFELGINLSQPPGEAVGSAPVARTGLAIRIDNRGLSPLRAQLVSPDSDVDNTRWCAELPVSGSTHVLWETFNTACWNASGAGYESTPLRSVAVVIPGSNVAPVPFDFCLEGFADGDQVSDAVLDLR